MARPTFDPATVTMQDAKTGSIPSHSAEAILTDVKTGSAFMLLAKEVPMEAPIEKYTHLSGVGAYWVDEGQRIETSKPTWLQLQLIAHKMGVIIPTTKENLRHSVSQFFELMTPEVAKAFYTLFDRAAFSGLDSPFTQSVLAAATAAGDGHIVEETANKYDDVNDAMAAVEAADLVPNGVAATNQQKVKYRSTKDGNGMPIFNAASEGEPARVVGLPVAFIPNAAFGNSGITEIVGDWNNAYYGILDSMEYEILTEATLTTITDENGDPISLAERDMVALKATMSVAMLVVKEDAFAVVTKAEETPPNP